MFKVCAEWESLRYLVDDLSLSISLSHTHIVGGEEGSLGMEGVDLLETPPPPPPPTSQTLEPKEEEEEGERETL